MTNLTPQPLPPNARALRNFRYEANVHDVRNERGSYPQIATGRFTSFEDARRWADEVYPDAWLVNVSYLSARTGWVSRSAGARREGVWA